MLGLVAAGLAAAADLSEKELAAARKLNLNKCSKCHQLYRPGDYSEERWQEWMAKMNRKARLEQEQAALLERFFASERARARQPAGASKP